jgi:endonuclease YncB( thermonuclease family)
VAQIAPAPELRRRTWSALPVALLFAVIAAVTIANDFVGVKRVVDGDTLVVENGERVRLIGVDTPETKRPNTPVQYFGKEASGFV